MQPIDRSIEPEGSRFAAAAVARVCLWRVGTLRLSTNIQEANYICNPTSTRADLYIFRADPYITNPKAPGII